jgi:hypothetical protein
MAEKFLINGGVSGNIIEPNGEFSTVMFDWRVACASNLCNGKN